MPYTLACQRCGNVGDIPEVDAAGEPNPPPEEAIYSCDVCKARIAYGKAVPRTVVHRDGNFIVVRFDATELSMDREYARLIAEGILSVV